MFWNKIFLIILTSKYLKIAQLIELIHFWIQIPIYLRFVCTMMILVLSVHLAIKSIHIKFLHSTLCWEICHFKYRSRLNDIHLIVLSTASYVGKYGYGSILSPLIEDLKILETYGITVSFNGAEHHFKSTRSMVIADNLAALALGGFFCSFFMIQRFCRFCNIRRDQLNQRNLISNYYHKLLKQNL